MKLRWLSAIVFGAALVSAPVQSTLFAQTKTQPSPTASGKKADSAVVVVAINSIDKVIPNIQHLVRNAAGGAVAGPISVVVNQYANGIDKTRPLGVFVDLDDAGTPVPMGCLPLKNIKEFLEQLSIFGEANELGNGVYEWSLGSPIYAKKVGDWLFVAQSEDALEGAAEAKAASLAKMIESYDIRIHVNPTNIPEEMVDFFVSQMEAGLEQSMAAQRENMDKDEAAATQAASEQMIAQLREAIEGTEKLVVGVSVKRDEKKTFFDVLSQFVAESRFAGTIQKYKSSKTAFAAIPQSSSMMTLKSHQIVESQDINQIERTMETAIKAAYKAIDEKSDDAASAKKAKDLINRMVDIIMESAKQGKLDSALDVSADGDLGIVASIGVADGTKVEALAADIAKEAAKEKAPVQIAIGTGKHAGFNLHKVTAKLPPEADDSARKVFGDSVTVSIGTSPKAVLVAVGKKCDAILKTAIDRANAKPSDPAKAVEGKISMTQLLNYVQSIKPTPISEAMLAATTSDNDRILVDSALIDRGSVVRLSIDDGVIKGIAAGVKAGQNAGGGF